MKYDYNICTESNEEVFRRQCIALEKNIPGIKKEELLDDVDGSLIQRYSVNRNLIRVYNDVEVGAVYVKSDIELKHFFNKQ